MLVAFVRQLKLESHVHFNPNLNQQERVEIEVVAEIIVVLNFGGVLIPRHRR
jgi:hypothetical protein